MKDMEEQKKNIWNAESVRKKCFLLLVRFFLSVHFSPKYFAQSPGSKTLVGREWKIDATIFSRRKPALSALLSRHPGCHIEEPFLSPHFLSKSFPPCTFPFISHPPWYRAPEGSINCSVCCNEVKQKCSFGAEKTSWGKHHSGKTAGKKNNYFSKKAEILLGVIAR